MRDFVIMTDSCCDLTDEMARELGIVVVPLSLEMGGQTYRNWAGWPGHRLPGLLQPHPCRRDRHHLRRQRGGFSGADAGDPLSGEGYFVSELFLRPLHHLSVRRHRRRRSAGGIPGRAGPGGGQPVRLSGPGAAGVSVRPGKGRRAAPSRDCGTTRRPRKARSATGSPWTI